MYFDAVVFPGQGSQRLGMALDFADRFPESRKVFDAATSALSFDVAKVCEDSEQVIKTEFTQPCVLTAEVAMFEALRARFHWNPSWFGGHSLGEYAALVAAGVIPFQVAIRLVSARGKIMSMENGTGGMVAVITSGLPADELRRIANISDVDVANENSPDQIVLSGERDRLENCGRLICSRFKDREISLIPLAVSAPFHSRFMETSSSAFRKVLEASAADFAPERSISVASNVTGKFYPGSREALVDLLARQISSPVRWRENMAVLMSRALAILEIGPNRTLGSFFRALGRNVSSVTDLRTARRVFGEEMLR